MAEQRTAASYQDAIAALKERRSALAVDPDTRLRDMQEIEAAIAALRAEQIAAFPELMTPVDAE